MRSLSRRPRCRTPRGKIVAMDELYARSGVDTDDPDYLLCQGLIETQRLGSTSELASVIRDVGLGRAAAVLARADEWFRFARGRSASVGTLIAERLAQAGERSADKETGALLGEVAGRMVWATSPGTSPDLSFRNVDADPAGAVEAWPHQAIETAIERGSLPDWRRLAGAVRSGEQVEASVQECLSYADAPGAAVLRAALRVGPAPHR